MKDKNVNTDLSKNVLCNENIRYFDPKLISVAQKAQEAPREKFSNLLHHVTMERVERQLKQINNGSAVGPDKLSKQQTLEHLDWLLPKELDRIHKKKYQAPAMRRVYIPKANGEKRPLGIGNILDRAIQGGVAEILSHIYEQDFLKCSFGFRPNISAHNALATLDHTVMKEKNYYLLEVDIKNFFGTINHVWMMEFLRHRISDKRVLKLLESWLKAGVMENGNMIDNKEGTAQGGAISPLLANIYLHYVLDLWFEKKINPRLKKKARLIRYCDDFVIAFNNRVDLKEVEKLLVVRLKQFGLEIAESKTHVTYLGPKDNNQKALGARRVATFLGFTIYSSMRRSGKGIKVVFKTERNRFARGIKKFMDRMEKLMHYPVETQANMVNAILRGHFNYYGLTGNAKSLSKFRNISIWKWRRVMSRTSQNKYINWTEMGKIIEKYKIVKCRLRIKFNEMHSYVIV